MIFTRRFDPAGPLDGTPFARRRLHRQRQERLREEMPIEHRHLRVIRGPRYYARELWMPKRIEIHEPLREGEA